MAYNSGNKRSDLGKARRSKLLWFKPLLLWTEMSNLLLALGQQLYLGEMENKDFCPPILGCFKA